MAALRAAATTTLLSQATKAVEGHRLARRRLLAGLLLLGTIRRALAEEVRFASVRAVLITSRGRFPLRLELARTPDERARGLMFRRELAADAGMLFDFGGSGPISMWMKNTYVPLDMLFFDEQLRVVWMFANAQPLSEQIISPPRPAAYVLELRASSIRRFGIRLGDRLSLDALP